MFCRYENTKYTLLLILVLLASCAEKKAPLLTIAQQNARIDSIVKVERKELLIIEQERLKDRMSIELKARVDSILKQHQPVLPNPVIVPIADTLALPDNTQNPPSHL